VNKGDLVGLSDAAQRVRKVGLANALGDNHVAEHLPRAPTHASPAIAIARDAKRRRRRSLVVPLTATVGAGVLAGAGYIVLNRHVAAHGHTVRIPEQPASSID
jgi:hypothetical protein